VTLKHEGSAVIILYVTACQVFMHPAARGKKPGAMINIFIISGSSIIGGASNPGSFSCGIVAGNNEYLLITNIDARLKI
jgi:hypothetical protein